MSQDYSPSKNWTARELLDWTESYFRQKDIPSARLDAELLLAGALGVDRLGLLTKEFEQVVDDEVRAVFRDFVKRRGLKEPVAYLTGEKEFYSLPFISQNLDQLVWSLEIPAIRTNLNSLIRT